MQMSIMHHTFTGILIKCGQYILLSQATKFSKLYLFVMFIITDKSWSFTNTEVLWKIKVVCPASFELLNILICVLWLCMSSSVLFFYAFHSVLVNSYIKMNLQHIVKWNYPPTTAITGSSTQHKQACRITHFIWNTHYQHSCPLKLKERNSFPQLLQLMLRFASEKPFPAITETNSAWHKLRMK